jgi:anaphase-promoting complex subunit 2
LLSCIPDFFPAGIKKLFELDLAATSSLLCAPTSSYPFSPLINQLTTLGLLKRFQPVLFSVGYDAIEERIETVCRGEWLDSSSASLEGMIRWFRQEIGVWLLKVLEAADQCMVPSSDQPDMSRVIEIVRPAMSRFEYHIYKSMSELRSASFLIEVTLPQAC